MLSTFLLLAGLALFAQQRITGVVTNAANQPMDNVSVTVKGTARGAELGSGGAKPRSAAGVHGGIDVWPRRVDLARRAGAQAAECLFRMVAGLRQGEAR